MQCKDWNIMSLTLTVFIVDCLRLSVENSLDWLVGVGCDGLFWSVTGAVQVYRCTVLTCHNHQPGYMYCACLCKPHKPETKAKYLYLSKGFRIQNFIFASGLKESCRNKILGETWFKPEFCTNRNRGEASPPEIEKDKKLSKYRI